MYQKILVPVDGSETSNLGLTEAIKLAKRQGAQVRLVHIVNEFILDYTYSTTLYADKVIDGLRDRGRNVLKEAEARVRQGGIVCDGVLVESIGGRAAEFIVQQAKTWGADVIVMGTHGRRGLARLTLGSDAEQVVRTAGVPVLLVRGTQKEAHVDVKNAAAA
jgi:nucleotide-binding universal stress UspA family protein